MLPNELEIGYKLHTRKSILNHRNIQAEILDIKKNENEYLFYVHYINFNKRLDEWITYDQFDTTQQVQVTKKEKNEDKKVKLKKEDEDKTYKVKNVQKIQIKNYLIDAWYFSPYPKRIAQSPIIYICPFCFFYFAEKEQLKKHDCGLKHPPGNEIYRQERKIKEQTTQEKVLQDNTKNDGSAYKAYGKEKMEQDSIEIDEYDLACMNVKKIKQESKKTTQQSKTVKKPKNDNKCTETVQNKNTCEESYECKEKYDYEETYEYETLSFFEIDGHIQKNYCRNLCLLSKLFLDHKTLYYDVDPFLFYILCVQKNDGFHVVGYFSKEKECVQGYNLACILTMPHCQRKGYGRILIDFSYLLSRKEGVSASPEKPLSDLGLLSYRKYWSEKIYACLTRNKDGISVREISTETGINEDDIVAVLSEEGAMKYYDGEACFVLKEWVNEKEGVDEGCLKWETVKNESTR